MLAFQLYLNSPQTKKILNKKPGEDGFSLIELVVVVAVLAILAAIAIPSFTSLNAEARIAGAKTTLANVVKMCAIKILDTNATNDTFDPINFQPSGYLAITSVSGTEANTGTCAGNNVYTLTPQNNSAGTTDLPSFSYIASPATGQRAKTCQMGTNTNSENNATGCNLSTFTALELADGAVAGSGTW